LLRDFAKIHFKFRVTKKILKNYLSSLLQYEKFSCKVFLISPNKCLNEVLKVSLAGKRIMLILILFSKLTMGKF